MNKRSKYPNIEDMLRKYCVHSQVETSCVKWVTVPDDEIRRALAEGIAKEILDTYIPSDINKIKKDVPYNFYEKTIYSVEYYVVRPEDIQEIVMNEVARYRELNPPTFIDENKVPII